jgi:CRP-like cAMP-binding protein
MASFNLYIDKIDIDLWREFCQREGKLRHYLKREYFLRIGEVPKYFGYIESGCFKYTVIDSSGEEHITGFAPRNNLAGDFYSAIRHAPALNDLKATVNSTVWIIDANKVRQWLDARPNMSRSFAEDLFRMAHERYVNLYRKSPKERYLELLKCSPDILQQVTLKELASYLQITPTHLSRIRKEILSGK